jgi:predicted dehydrogenase
MQTSLTCGVIGYGGAFNMGRQHLTEMQKAGMIPTAVCEIDPARLAVATGDFPGIETYATVGEMLAKSAVQLITIITPHDTHAPLALQSLAAGRHVVCEKPFAIGTAACDEVIAAAEKAGKVVSTYHNRHWDGWILRAVDKILGDEKVIGEVYKIRLTSGQRNMPKDWWRSDMSKSGGILYDWGVHLLEYALQLLPGARLTEVSGFNHTGYWASLAPKDQPWVRNPIEDEGRLIARFHTGQWIEMVISSLDKPSPNLMEVVGTEGVYTITWPGYELWKTDGAGTATVTSGKHYDNAGHKFYENIAAHLRGGEPLVITPQWARRPIHMIDLAIQSAAAGLTLVPKYE